MDLPSAGQLAHHLLRDHGLAANGWTFRFNQRKRSLGICNYTAKRIELSAPFTVRNDDATVRTTLLHEIAHALTPPSRYRSGEGPHGPAWQAACQRLGIAPERLNTTAAAPPGNYRAKCPGCGKTHHRHRRPMKDRTYNCRTCGPTRGRLAFRRQTAA